MGPGWPGHVDTCPPANLPPSAEQAPDAWQKVGLAAQAERSSHIANRKSFEKAQGSSKRPILEPSVSIACNT